ncbi:hypothetical protein L0Z72_01740 [candidate division KSB1 bacterium]|nr:hypothetical protein [candidate division KSB1 bacterium]
MSSFATAHAVRHVSRHIDPPAGNVDVFKFWNTGKMEVHKKANDTIPSF